MQNGQPDLDSCPVVTPAGAPSPWQHPLTRTGPSEFPYSRIHSPGWSFECPCSTVFGASARRSRNLVPREGVTVSTAFGDSSAMSSEATRFTPSSVYIASGASVAYWLPVSHLVVRLVRHSCAIGIHRKRSYFSRSCS